LEGEIVLVSVLVNVLVKVLLKGLRVSKVRLVRLSVLVSVINAEVKPRSGRESRVEIGTDTDDANEPDEPEWLFAGEDDLDS
jgi:hypothetical protein